MPEAPSSLYAEITARGHTLIDYFWHKKGAGDMPAPSCCCLSANYAVSVACRSGVCRGAFSLAAALSVLLQLHLAEAQRDAGRDIAAVKCAALALAQVVGVGVRRGVAYILAPVEYVLDIDEGAQLAVEEVGAHTHIDPIAGAAGGHKSQRR